MASLRLTISIKMFLRWVHFLVSETSQLVISDLLVQNLLFDFKILLSSNFSAPLQH